MMPSVIGTFMDHEVAHFQNIDQTSHARNDEEISILDIRPFKLAHYYTVS